MPVAEKKGIARKTHICDLCKEEIKKGDKQASWRITPKSPYWEGEFQSYNMHPNCWGYLDWMKDASSEGWDEDMLYDAISEIGRMVGEKLSKAQTIQIIRNTDWKKVNEEMNKIFKSGGMLSDGWGKMFISKEPTAEPSRQSRENAQVNPAQTSCREQKPTSSVGLKAEAEKRIKELAISTDISYSNIREFQIRKDQHEKSTAYGVAFAIEVVKSDEVAKIIDRVFSPDCSTFCVQESIAEAIEEAIAERILSEIKAKKGER